MSPDVRRTALRAAAKAAIIVALGCSGGGGASQARTDSELSGNEPGSCAEHLDSLAEVNNVDELAEGDPLRGATGVYGAFSDIEARNSARTQECCAEEIGARGSDAAHRWACCSALGDVPANAAACTPWGPPCPPEMV